MSTKRTALYDTHVALGAKMVVFAGYDMPVRYSGDLEEHFAVRDSVGMFDVSHMGEFVVRGSKALDLIQAVTSNDASKLTIGKAQYSCLPNEKGGIVDDIIVYRLAEEQYLIVVNASNIEKDWNWISQHNTYGAEMINISEETSLLAVQGKNALATLQKLTTTNLAEIPYYGFVRTTFNGVENVIIAATGYTGEAGFEVFFDAKHSVNIWNAIMEAGKPFNLLPIGLGARDTLRLEMGYCLYGNDINDETSPLEAGLGWITKLQKGAFTSSDIFTKQKETGVEKHLVGFVMIDRAIPRHDYEITDAQGNVIGKVTSGTQSPNLKVGVGLGYVKTGFHTEGSAIFIKVRDKLMAATVKKPPFLVIQK